MRVLVDTNIILDLLEVRHPHFEESQASLTCCHELGFEATMAWHTISNAFYIYSKKVGSNQAQQALAELLNLVMVVTTGHSDVLKAFALGFADLEDALQAAAAEACSADLILTRNVPDFALSSVEAINPGDFLLRFVKA